MTKLKGYFKGENDYFIDRYRVNNEVSESLLYVYDSDNDLITTLDMPEFWEKYLFEAQETDEEIELRFEEYVKYQLGL